MSELPLDALWVYLSGSPLVALTATLTCYLLATLLFERSGQWPLLNPVLISVVVLAISLTLSGVPYASYFEGAQFVHFLLGPATVALAYPLYRELPTLRRHVFPIALAMLALTAVFAILTGVFGAVIAVPFLRLLRVEDDAARGLAIGLVSHGIGTARAFRISERAGAYAGLAMALTATLSAIALPYLLNAIRA